MFGSALCISLGAASGVVEVADRHSGRAKKVLDLRVRKGSPGC